MNNRNKINSEKAENLLGRSEEVHIRIASINIVTGDAIGNFAVRLSDMFRANGVPCTLYAQGTDYPSGDKVKSILDLSHDVRETDLLFFNFSIFDPNLEMIKSLPCKKILYYHNITPPELLDTYNAELAENCAKGYKQLKSTGQCFDTYIANSEMTKRELLHFLTDDGVRIIEKDVFVCPPFINIDEWENLKTESVELPVAGIFLLYVGRIAPHKKIEDLVFLFNEYHRLKPESALIIAGGIGSPEYYSHICSLLDKYPDNIAEKVYILNNLTDGQIKFLYKSSSLFVTMSEHEGFCIPLVEAMYFRKPVFAFAQEAVKETLGKGGRIFDKKDFSAVATEMNRVLEDKEEYDNIVSSQDKRLEEISSSADGTVIWEAIERTLVNAGTV